MDVPLHLALSQMLDNLDISPYSTYGVNFKRLLTLRDETVRPTQVFSICDTSSEWEITTGQNISCSQDINHGSLDCPITQKRSI